MVYLVELESGQRYTMPKNDLVGRMMYNDLHLPKPDGRNEPYSLKVQKQLDYLLYFQESAVDVEEPKSWKQAMNGPDADLWKQALDAELLGLQQRGVFKIVKTPKNANVQIGRAHV